MCLLQLPQPLPHGLQAQVQLVAGAEQAEQVAGAGGAARVVHQRLGRGQPVRPDLELLSLGEEKRRFDRNPRTTGSSALTVS